jgi:mono/diheme cytochrome c family protein
MTKGKAVFVAAAGILAAAQLIPVDRTNPADGTEIAARREVAAVLERSCFDCHSHRTTWPWYSRLAPVSWLVSHDVEEGREQLNFSRWGEYSDKDRGRLAEEAVEEVEKGAMPLKIYLLLHGGAKVDARGLEVLRQWAREEARSGDRDAG